MKKNKVITLTISIILIVSILCTIFVSCDKNKKDDNTIRLIEVTHSVFYAPLYVAIENGYFKDKNLDIKLSNGGGADNCMTALLTDAADIALMGPEASIYVLKERQKNPPKIFAQLTRKDGSFLMARSKNDNFSWTDLENKEIIGGRRGGVPALTVEYVLKKNNLINGENVTINYNVEYDLIGSAFQSGTGDYCTMFEPAATNMQNAGYGYIVASVGEEAGEYPYTAFSALNSYINKNENKISNFTEALYQGMLYVENHTAREIATLIQGLFNGTSIEVLESSIQSYKNINAYSITPVMKEEDLNRLQSIIIEGGIINSYVKFNSLVDNSFANKAIENYASKL